ncbi:MAG: hypothetical protein K0S24_1904 [Sphingobacterium sp.]|jgi:xanthine dehydrogenase iron-sulfur cluster and FAD-binding subunit A|nr:hypothetical protein [Sphingobacterium sp.]
MKNEKKVLGTLVNAQEDDSTKKVEGYCTPGYVVSCSGTYSGSGSATNEELDILI